eukprot:scaffold49253_cov58-Phaeocystis_antarctica.AAC.3
MTARGTCVARAWHAHGICMASVRYMHAWNAPAPPIVGALMAAPSASTAPGRTASAARLGFVEITEKRSYRRT